MDNCLVFIVRVCVRVRERVRMRERVRVRVFSLLMILGTCD